MDQKADWEERGRELRNRLETLSRRRRQEERDAADSAESPAGQPAPRKPPAEVVYQRGLPRRHEQAREARDAKSSWTMPTEVVALEAAAEGLVTHHTERGAAFVIRTPVDQVAGGPLCSRAFSAALEEAGSPLRRLIPPGSELDSPGPRDVVVADLETAGLGSAPLFLIGAMTWTEGGWEVQQYLARDYSEEAAAIALFAEHNQARGLLITFNGKSFDLPMIRTRAAANGVPLAWDPVHLDLLHVSRRVWRGALPDCRLQTLETFVCQRPRHDDIPSHLIPEAYHEYVRTQNAAQIVEVLRHNVLDLVTLADLTTRLPRE